MSILWLLAACGLPVDSDSPRGDGEACDWESPERIPLAWETPGSTGVSPEDAFGFGVGSFATPLTWDDGTASTLALRFTVLDSYELDQGPATCPVAVGADVAWTAADGGRIDLSGEVSWLAETHERIPTPSVGLHVPLDPVTLGFAPLQPGSDLLLSTWYRAETSLLTFQIFESWPLGGAMVRSCVRVAHHPDAVRPCEDVDTTAE